MRAIYWFLSHIVAALAAPVLMLLAIFGDTALFNFLGFYKGPVNDNDRRSIWIHASSVGEFKAAVLLLDSLAKNLPETRFVITVFTTRGMKVARDELPDDFEIYYLPMECTLAIRRAFRRINPGMIVLIETELWPNLVHHALERNVPIAIVNGRLSDKSFARYRSARSLFEPLLGAISYIHTQSEKDARRFAALGASPSRIQTGGNIKISGMISNLSGFDKQSVLKELHLRDDVRYIVLGSTRPGEEELALDAFNRIRTGHPDVKAILAPRHTVRVEEIEKIVSNHRLICIRRSDMADNHQDYDVMILDTMGELWKVYGIAECAFVGGSLVPIGGHNPLEPIALGVPTCFGPHMDNCIDLARKCIEHSLATTVHDGNDLARFLEDCLSDKIQKPESARVLSVFSSDLGEVTERLLSLWREQNA